MSKYAQAHRSHDSPIRHSSRSREGAVLARPGSPSSFKLFISPRQPPRCVIHGYLAVSHFRCGEKHTVLAMSLAHLCFLCIGFLGQRPTSRPPSIWHMKNPTTWPPVWSMTRWNAEKSTLRYVGHLMRPVLYTDTLRQGTMAAPASLYCGSAARCSCAPGALR